MLIISAISAMYEFTLHDLPAAVVSLYLCAHVEYRHCLWPLYQSVHISLFMLIIYLFLIFYYPRLAVTTLL